MLATVAIAVLGRAFRGGATPALAAAAGFGSVVVVAGSSPHQ